MHASILTEVHVCGKCSWILKDEIPLIRAIRLIPQDMKDRLPPAYHYALDTKV